MHAIKKVYSPTELLNGKYRKVNISFDFINVTELVSPRTETATSPSTVSNNTLNVVVHECKAQSVY
jgi:hypothetical protein